MVYVSQHRVQVQQQSSRTWRARFSSQWFVCRIHSGPLRSRSVPPFIGIAPSASRLLCIMGPSWNWAWTKLSTCSARLQQLAHPGVLLVCVPDTIEAAPLRCSAVPVVQSLLHMMVCVTWLQVLAGALHPLWPVRCTHVLPLRCPVQKPGWSSSLLQASTCSLKIRARVDRNGLSSLPDIGVSAAGWLASWCKSVYSIA